MSLTQDIRTGAKHRRLTRWELTKLVSRLEQEADEQTCRMVELATQVDELRAARNRIAAEYDEQTIAHQATVERLTVHRDDLFAQVAALKARFGPELAAEANANRIDVPPMTRIGADQDTAPIDVRPLWDAADAGLLGPVTDPGHIPDLGVEDTQPIPAP